MNCTEVNLKIPFTLDFKEIRRHIHNQLHSQTILRFITRGFDKNHFDAHLIVVDKELPHNKSSSLWDFKARAFHNQKNFNICFLIPTGIGCEIGGHAGDGTAVLKLFEKSCNKIITHPNVVNASDLNEMPTNTLYVEGSHITQLLMGTVGLSETKSNRVLVIIDEDKNNGNKFQTAAINSVNGARAILGMEAQVHLLKPSQTIKMKGSLSGNTDTDERKRAVGQISHLEHLHKVLYDKSGSYDAVAITSKIHINPATLHEGYTLSQGEMANPWGAVEAMLTHFISSEFGLPSAHAPMLENNQIAQMDFGVVDSRIAPEVVSTTFFHCVLKGLHQSPKVIKDKSLLNHPDIFSAKDISALVIPDGILGLPVLAALHQGIKVIAVKNSNSMKNNLRNLPWSKGQFYQCQNYLEACGVLNCLKAGISVEATKRPFRTLNPYAQPVKKTEQRFSFLPEAPSVN